MHDYLKETPMLDFKSDSVQSLVKKHGWSHLDDKNKVKEIYDFVRDDILFGYNVDDSVPASRVLKDGYGQCNTKGTLLMALLRAVGIECRVHGFTIDKVLQKGAMTGFVYKNAPNEIFHSWVEVCVSGKWYNLEGFILDAKYLEGLHALFKSDADGSFTGYGVAVKDFENPPINFDCCDTYIQSEGIVRDFGVYDDPDSLLKEHGQSIKGLKKFAYRHLGRKLMNKNVAKVRKYGAHNKNR